MRVLSLLNVLIPALVAGCSSDPSPLEKARAAGYSRSEEYHDVVELVRPTDDGDWDVGIGASARGYRISREFSPCAEDLATNARKLAASRRVTYITIWVHETAPKTKTAGMELVPGTPAPWIIVRFGDEPDPSAERRMY